MIEGYVNSRHQPIITLTVQAPSGQTRQLDAIVDTGFNHFLSLPSTLVSELELPFESRLEVVVADGRVTNLDIHNVSVLWDGQLRDIQVCASHGTPLVGMLMLDGHRLCIDVEIGGQALIEAK